MTVSTLSFLKYVLKVFLIAIEVEAKSMLRNGIGIAAIFACNAFDPGCPTLIVKIYTLFRLWDDSCHL